MFKGYKLSFMFASIIHVAPFVLLVWGQNGKILAPSASISFDVRLEVMPCVTPCNPAHKKSEKDRTLAVHSQPVVSQVTEHHKTEVDGCAEFSVAEFIKGNPKPMYPEEARIIGIEGEVLVEVIFQDGDLISCRIIESPHDLLSNAAKQQIAQWAFPKTKQRMTLKIPVEFQLI
ncbi:MAG: TonB family protein [Candidatus Paracaedibacteraceae bacterium]|nr:TonB family protein [Candidatus Paracaedibacteraceae bacterium]